MIIYLKTQMIPHFALVITIVFINQSKKSTVIKYLNIYSSGKCKVKVKKTQKYNQCKHYFKINMPKCVYFILWNNFNIIFDILKNMTKLKKHS